MKKDFVIYRCGSWSCGGLNSGLFACKANTLPLSYNPLLIHYLTTINIGAVYSGMELHDISFCSPNKRSGVLLVRDKYLHLSRQNP